MTYAFPAPEASPETQGFWDDVRQGQLSIGRCHDTGQAFYPPRTLSPFTLGETSREPSTGEGVVYTWTHMARTPNGSLTLGYVTLDEGPTIFTAFTGCAAEPIAVGTRVRVAFTPTEGELPAVTFMPV